MPPLLRRGVDRPDPDPVRCRAAEPASDTAPSFSHRTTPASAAESRWSTSRVRRSSSACGRASIPKARNHSSNNGRSAAVAGRMAPCTPLTGSTRSSAKTPWAIRRCGVTSFLAAHALANCSTSGKAPTTLEAVLHGPASASTALSSRARARTRLCGEVRSAAPTGSPFCSTSHRLKSDTAPGGREASRRARASDCAALRPRAAWPGLLEEGAGIVDYVYLHGSGGTGMGGETFADPS